jgi:UPF0716 family protein affecting phage T7 exclusion
MDTTIIGIWVLIVMMIVAATLGLSISTSRRVRQLQKGQEVTQLTHCIRVDKTHYLCSSEK